MTAAQLRRLIGILGRLGSDHGGERAAAGLLASRMLQEAGLQWSDLIHTIPVRPNQGRVWYERYEPPPPPPQSPPPPPPMWGLPETWQADIALLKEKLAFCTGWERGFIASVARRSTVSAKQANVVTSLATAFRMGVRGTEAEAKAAAETETAETETAEAKAAATRAKRVANAAAKKAAQAAWMAAKPNTATH